MHNPLDGLDKEFLQRAQTLLTNLQDKGIYMVPISGVRTLEEQAKNWRKGRSLFEIKKKIFSLRKSQGNYIADVIEHVGPQMDKDKVTNAIPGFSWHNWGQALDCYVCYEGDKKKLIFNGNDPLFKSYALERYKAYAIEAVKLGLTAGYYFPMKDMPHIQLNKKEVNKIYGIPYVNDYFKSSSKNSITCLSS